MEAQYALQKKKPLVPLMLVEGYEADGWLGLLLGTSMWYGLYGDVLSSPSAFEDRMDALCRELGDRGRADAVIGGGDDGSQMEPELESDGVSVSLPNLPPNLVSGKSKEPLCSVISGIAPKEYPTLSNALLNFSSACSGMMYSMFAIAPTYAFKALIALGFCTSDVLIPLSVALL